MTTDSVGGAIGWVPGLSTAGVITSKRKLTPKAFPLDPRLFNTHLKLYAKGE